MSFMNRSGGPVQSVANFYKIPVESILVAYETWTFRRRHQAAARVVAPRVTAYGMSPRRWRSVLAISDWHRTPGDRSRC